jgi:hypothetical protein
MDRCSQSFTSRDKNCEYLPVIKLFIELKKLKCFFINRSTFPSYKSMWKLLQTVIFGHALVRIVSRAAW